MVGVIEVVIAQLMVMNVVISSSTSLIGLLFSLSILVNDYENNQPSDSNDTEQCNEYWKQYKGCASGAARVVAPVRKGWCNERRVFLCEYVCAIPILSAYPPRGKKYVYIQQSQQLDHRELDR